MLGALLKQPPTFLSLVPVTVYEQGMPHRSSVLRRTCTCRHKCPHLATFQSLCTVSGQQRLHIITLHCNRPDFMLLQRKSFHHFLRDLNVDWTIVFDNPDSSVENALRAHCESISFTFGHTTCLQLPVDAKTGAAPGDASGTHSQIFSWLWREVAMKRLRGQLIVIVDGDMFSIAPFSFREYMRGFSMAGPQQHREIKCVA